MGEKETRGLEMGNPGGRDGRRDGQAGGVDEGVGIVGKAMLERRKQLRSLEWVAHPGCSLQDAMTSTQREQRQKSSRGRDAAW